MSEKRNRGETVLWCSPLQPGRDGEKEEDTWWGWCYLLLLVGKQGKEGGDGERSKNRRDLLLEARQEFKGAWVCVCLGDSQEEGRRNEDVIAGHNQKRKKMMNDREGKQVGGAGVGWEKRRCM
jgi:hypothetical protein